MFEEHGLSLRCDRNDRIHTIFLEGHGPKHLEQPLSEIPFVLSRAQVLDRLGTPAMSGSGTTDPVLGAFGAWDRFAEIDSTLHIEYQADADCIRRITLLVNEVVPSG